MRPTGLRFPVVLIVLGSVGVAAGSIVLFLLFVNFSSGTRIVVELAPPIGYGLVGLAWWFWTPAAAMGPIGAMAMRRSSRVLAVASGVMALGYLAQFYGNIRFYYYTGHQYGLPHLRLELASLAALGVGFLLAAAGFWIASNLTQSTAPRSLETGNTGVQHDVEEAVKTE